MKFARFMSGVVGRALRVVAGALLIGVGLYVVQGNWGYVVAAVGVLPLLAGILNVCAIAPLIGAPFRGRDSDRRQGA